MGSAPSAYDPLASVAPPEYDLLKSLDLEGEDRESVMIDQTLSLDLSDSKSSSPSTPVPASSSGLLSRRNTLLYLLQSQCTTLLALSDCAKVRIDMSPSRVCTESLRLYDSIKRSYTIRTGSNEAGYVPRLEACIRVVDSTRLMCKLYRSHTVGNKQAEGFADGFDGVLARAEGLVGRLLDIEGGGEGDKGVKEREGR